jgi:hypothetical protein
VSNYLAIATVTAAISHLLEGIRADIPGTKVSVKPPDVANTEAPPTNKLNIFLYRVAQNQAYRNEELPARDSQGVLTRSPLLALNLHYLLTAYAADNDDLLAQQILASAMRILNENPVLSRDIIQDAIAARQALKTSDLTDQIEAIRLTFQPMNLEELSKLWSTFFQTNYRISVAYEATVVLLESKLPSKPSLPVKERLLYVLPFRQPVIEAIEPQVVESKAGVKISISGRNLLAKAVKVNFEGTEVALKPADIWDNRITVEVPAGLGAGIRQVQVVHPMMLGSPAKEHGGYESNVAAFVLSPRVTSLPSAKIKPGGDLAVSFEPPAGPKQKIEVLVGDLTIPVPQRQEGSAPVDKVTVKLPDLANGKYLFRLRISGAESFLKSDDDPQSQTYGKYVGPTVEVKA